MNEREVLIRETCRTGVQTVEREGDRYFLTIRNRTYSSEHEVPVETARRYFAAMHGSARGATVTDPLAYRIIVMDGAEPGLRIVDRAMTRDRLAEVDLNALVLERVDEREAYLERERELGEEAT